jgi:hypothetical protein
MYKLPQLVQRHAMTKKYSFEEANSLLLNQTTFPSDFDQWDLANKRGYTVAHTAAMMNSLPADFNQWALADENGWPVAHEAALYRHLPKDFDQWDLVDNLNKTVASWAIIKNDLSEDDYMKWKIMQTLDTKEDNCHTTELML